MFRKSKWYVVHKTLKENLNEGISLANTCCNAQQYNFSCIILEM